VRSWRRGGRKELDFIAFPVRIGGNGWFVRSGSPEESLVQVLRIIMTTPEGGWPGSAAFGMRDILAGLGPMYGARLAAITQLNQTLENLGIDWVRVEAIEREQGTTPHTLAYVFTLSFAGRGTGTHRIEM
jgi:hypothetical protein